MAETTPACLEPAPPDLIQGVEEFNRREFFACHETLEALWMRERRPVRELYQGIIQVGVGLYHAERDNYVGAVRTAQRGLDRLRLLPGTCQQVDVAQLVSETELVLRRFVELGPSRLRAFDRALVPTITLSGPNAARPRSE